MIYIKRSQPAPESLASEKLANSGTYRTSDVVKRLYVDFKNKCYICEEAGPTTINIEHFTPHCGDRDMMFGWENLFLSCGHCNNTKSQSEKYNNILNCTVETDKVDTNIKYTIDPFPKTRVVLELRENSLKTDNTLSLLNAVYNGNTPVKRLESANLRTKLDKEIEAFNSILLDYQSAPNEDKRNHIVSHLNSTAGGFTAFKRWIIWENPVLNGEFGEFCK